MMLASYLIKHRHQANVSLRLFGTLFIIAVSAFSIGAGYDDQQIAAGIVLFAIIAVYILAKIATNRLVE